MYGQLAQEETWNLFKPLEQWFSTLSQKLEQTLWLLKLQKQGWWLTSTFFCLDNQYGYMLNKVNSDNTLY